MSRAFRIALLLALMMAAFDLRLSQAGTENACEYDPAHARCIDWYCTAGDGHCILVNDGSGYDCLCQLGQPK